MPKTFVFIEGQTGLMGQVWHTEQVSGEGKEKLSPVFRYELSKEEAAAFDHGFITVGNLIKRFRDATQN